MRHLVSLFAGLFIGAMVCYSIGCGPKEGADTGAEGEDSGQAMGGEMSKEEMVKRGEYLVFTMGCNDCHSPKKMGGMEPDPARLLSGHPADEKLPEYDPATIAPGKWILATQGFTAYVGPWGVSFAANLTPDPTGLGGWTDAQFMKAVREGKYKGMDNTRPMMPPMPWPTFARMPDEDIKAMFAYLQSVPPVSNAVPAWIPPAGGPPGGEAGAPPADSAAAPKGA